MQKFTTKQLLKILPMSEGLRKEVLSRFDSLSEDQKLEIKKICWLMFFELYNDKVEYEFKKTLLAVKDKKGKLKSNLYQKIEEQTHNELRSILLQKTEGEAVVKVRKELKEQLGGSN